MKRISTGCTATTIVSYFSMILSLDGHHTTVPTIAGLTLFTSLIAAGIAQKCALSSDLAMRQAQRAGRGLW